MKRILLLTFIIWVCLMCIFDLQQIGLFAQSNYEIEDDVSVEDTTEEALVSLDFKDADLKDVLKVFSQQSGLNFVAARNIEERKITLYMNDVLVEDALKTLLEANNLGLEQSPGSNILIVRAKPTLPIQTITRVYKIRFFHDNTSPGVYLMRKGGMRKSEEQIWTAVIQPLLSEFGSVINYLNILIITDVPDRFKLIDQVISEIDRPIPEVLIEVELIETTSGVLDNIGMKWNQQFMKYDGPATITPFPFTPWEKNHDGASEFSFSTPLADKDFSYGLISSQALGWVLDMLSEDSSTRFLSKPRILCQDREWAEIKVIADQIVSLKTTITSDGDKLTEVERMEVGTILRLVPIINMKEGYVSMLLEPTISRPINSVFTDPVSGANYVDPHERSLRTVVMAKDGETIAIGGFITTEDEETIVKVPWLGDIPLFGAFFKHTQVDKEDKELLIFITPKIVNPTEKVNLWLQEVAEQISVENREQHGTIESQPKQKTMQQEQPQQEVKSAPAKIPRKKELPFREQDDLMDFNVDLTLKSSSLGVVDLVK